MENITITVAVSGTCPNCRIRNNARVQTSGPVGTTCRAVCQGTCGNCGSALTLTGNAVITK